MAEGQRVRKVFGVGSSVMSMAVRKSRRDLMFFVMFFVMSS
jgi:hypothetical protein